MIPLLSDPATELFHWQRYLYFRPWYVDASVMDVASGEGYGTGYAGTFAKTALGFDISEEAVRHARSRYTHCTYGAADCCEVDYSIADTVVSFETIEHLPDPEKFLDALKTCKGSIAISTPNRKTHSPGNKLSDKPLNKFHTIEWTPKEFAQLIESKFPDRQVRFLSQEGNWPGNITEGLDDEAMYCIAVIGDAPIPQWPAIGLSMPTVDNVAQAQEAILAFTRYYPGKLHFAVVANGTNKANLAKWREFAKGWKDIVTLVESETNVGYGAGSNMGLDALRRMGGFDLYGVTNDDVYPSVACMSELADAAMQLQAMGHKPGMIGPVSNYVAGRQQVDIGAFDSLPGLMSRAETYLLSNHSSATPWPQIRGLLFLMTQECLDAVGGFDPIFGIGNFEDDDLNLRCKLAGFTNWIIDGAFLFHQGSQTFAGLKIDYEANIKRNQAAFMRKWDLSNLDEWLGMTQAPEGKPLFVPLTAGWQSSGMEAPMRVGSEMIDAIQQASDSEFAQFLAEQIAGMGPEARRKVLNTVKAMKTEVAAVRAA